MPPSLRLPDAAMLPAYAAALRTGWSPNNSRDVSAEHLAAIETDAPAFLARLQEGGAATVDLGGGRIVPRLPGPVFWIWDGAFCGVINLRYQPGTLDLPPHVSGHIGYAVVPWKRRQGLATWALRRTLETALARGLPRVLVTCDEGNAASRGVIEGAGGRLCGAAPDAEHGGTKLLFWLETRPA